MYKFINKCLGFVKTKHLFLLRQKKHCMKTMSEEQFYVLTANTVGLILSLLSQGYFFIMK